MSSDPSTAVSFGHSRLVQRRSTLVWRISGIRHCDLETGQHLSSPDFGNSGEQKKWSLTLYPRGSTLECRNYLSLFLSSASEEVVTATATVCIQNGCGIEEQFTKRSSFNTGGHGWKRFASRNKIARLPGDDLFISCVVQTWRLHDAAPATSPAMGNRTGNSLTCDLGRIFANQEFTDIVLTLNYKTKIGAHRHVLLSRPSVFTSLLTESLTAIQLLGVEEDIFREVMRFMYTDKCSLGNRSLEMMRAAHHLDFLALKLECVQYLCSHLTQGNVLDIAITAFSHREMEFYQRCLDYIAVALPSITFLPDWNIKLRRYPAIRIDIERHP